jgi:hypothetical protein
MKWLLGSAMASNVCVALGTIVFHGWNAAGAHAAARNTARFSSLWFMVAFAAPGLGRLVRGLPAGARLVQAFVAAHLVHFAVVGALIVSFETAHLAQKPLASAAILVFGFSLVVGAGVTATSRSRFYRYLHTATLYVLFLIFSLAFGQNAVKPLRLMAVPLALALILRLTSGWTFYTARIKSSN